LAVAPHSVWRRCKHAESGKVTMRDECPERDYGRLIAYVPTDKTCASGSPAI